MTIIIFFVVVVLVPLVGLVVRHGVFSFSGFAFAAALPVEVR